MFNQSAMTICLVSVMICGCSSMNRLRDDSYAPADPPPPPPRTEIAGSIFHINTSRFLFEDIKARRIGDTITVILEESTNASKSASTSGKTETDYDLPAPTFLGKAVTKDGRDVLVMDVEDDFEFKGNGDASQSNSLSGNITVTVVAVQANGNLKVRGEKLLTLNHGSEVVRIAGIVRPTDVTPENTILSTQIAAAEITYSGNGFVANANKPGWFTQFFNNIWPF